MKLPASKIKTSISFICVKLWNSLLQDAVEAKSTNGFKKESNLNPCLY